MEWGGTDNLPHFFLLILGASESFFFFFFFFFFLGGGGGAVEFNSGVEVRSYALPVFQMKLHTEVPSPYVPYLNYFPIHSIPSFKKCQFWNPLWVHILTDMSSFYLSLTGH